MKKLLFNTLLISLLWVAETKAQIIEMGEISKQELEMKSDPMFPDANAIVLYRDVNIYLGRYVEVHERIKIFNEEGYDYATIRIPYPDVTKIKGATYNLVDGRVVETQLDKDLIFTDEVIKDVEIKKFTFPNIAPGSIVELFYKSEKATGSDIDIQYDIPIKRVKVKVTNKSQLGIEILQNPRAFLNVSRIEGSNSTTITSTNVPALEPEKYVYDMDIYRSYLKINITAATDSFMFGSWKGLVDIIFEIDEFAQGIKSKGFYKDEVEQVVGNESDQLKKARLIYNYLKTEIKWNEDYGFVPEQHVRATFKDKEGSIADINMLFISMLNSVGLDARPVLISTKLNGIPLTASAGAFNALIAAVQINNKTHLFDVAHDKSDVNFLAPHFLNWEGLRILEDKSFDWVSLTKARMSPKNIIAKAEIDADLFLTGNVKERHGGYYSIHKNSEIKDLGENKIATILDYSKNGLEVSEVTTNNEKKGYTDISFDFELDNAIDEIDDKLYFSPLLFFTLDENPFQKDERTYSIDFGYPFKDQTMLTIKIPENYQIESMPEPARISLPDNAGSFTYRITGAGSNIQVSTAFQINTPVLAYDQYQGIKEFFKMRITKENEKIVLSKI
jgi:hypothetical protein